MYIFSVHNLNYKAILSLRAYRWHAQDSEVKVASLLKHDQSSKLLFQLIFLTWIFSVHKPNYEVILSLRAYRWHAKDSKVKVASF